MPSRLWSYLQRARLDLYLDLASAYHVVDVQDAGGVPGYFCHVMVRNNGRATVRNCRGRVIGIDVRSDGGPFVPAPEFVAPIFLKWAREPDFDPKDLEPGQARALDLCFTLASSPRQLRFFAPPSPNGVQLFPPGVYAVKLTVAGDHVRPITGEFHVDFTREWNQIVVRPAG